VAVVRPDQCMAPLSIILRQRSEANTQLRCLPGHFLGRPRRSQQIFRGFRCAALGGCAWPVRDILKIKRDRNVLG